MRALLNALLWIVGLVAGAAVLVVLIWAGTWAYVLTRAPSPDRPPSPQQVRERLFRLTVQHAATTEATWLRHDGDFTDASGIRFVKTAGWHQINVAGLSFTPDCRHATCYRVVEGKYVPGGDAAPVRTCSGPTS